MHDESTNCLTTERVRHLNTVPLPPFYHSMLFANFHQKETHL